MDKHYSQLTLKKRKEIVAGLDRGDPFRGIASLIGRQPSTVSREVRKNRHVRAYKARRSACRGRNWCKRVGVCTECVRKGAYCAGCDARDCRDESPAYADQVACDVLVGAPGSATAAARTATAATAPIATSTTPRWPRRPPTSAEATPARASTCPGRRRRSPSRTSRTACRGGCALRDIRALRGRRGRSPLHDIPLGGRRLRRADQPRARAQGRLQAARQSGGSRK